jgi:pimeloyl-ACP methyl ester carboxylesterase
VRGLRLHVALAGPEDGAPVVLQHGWPQHWWSWRHLIGPLADAGHRVIVPDMRGFGWSEYPADEDFRRETLVDDLFALCAALGHMRFSYVGHDWGAWIGWLACLRPASPVERALMISVRPPFPPPDGPDLSSLPQLAKLWYQGVLGSPLPAQAKHAFVKQVFVQGSSRPWASGELDPYLATLRQPAQTRATTLLYRQFLVRDLPGVIGGRYGDGHLPMPVRFLTGRDDPLFDEDSLEAARPYADDYEGEALDGVAHFVPEEAPEVVREHVLALLS